MIVDGWTTMVRTAPSGVSSNPMARIAARAAMVRRISSVSSNPAEASQPQRSSRSVTAAS